MTDDLLQEAIAVVAERAEHYGPPTVNFERIARLWEAYLADRIVRPITVEDVAMMSVLVKLARLMEDPTHRDSWLDIAGYAWAGHQVARSTNRIFWND